MPLQQTMVLKSKQQINRKISKIFDKEDIHYHTYLFQEDKELKIVIRDLHLKANPAENRGPDWTRFQPQQGHSDKEQKRSSANVHIHDVITRK